MKGNNIGTANHAPNKNKIKQSHADAFQESDDYSQEPLYGDSYHENQFDDYSQESQYGDGSCDFPQDDFSQESPHGEYFQMSTSDDFSQESQHDEFTQVAPSWDNQPRPTTVAKGRRRKRTV